MADDFRVKLQNAKPIVATISNKKSIQATVYMPSSIGGAYVDEYTGQYYVIPHPYDDQMLDTTNKLLTDDVVVYKIPTYETSNLVGTTFIIGD